MCVRGQDYCIDVPWTNVTDVLVEFPPNCNCASYYYWDTIDTGCTVDCGLVTNGGTKLNYDTCTCDPGFVWVVSNYIEVQCAVADCTKIAYTDGTPLTVSDECTCIFGFIWNAEHRACEIDCANIVDVNTTTNSGNVDAATCACNDGYHWNPDTYTCDLDPPTRECRNDSHSTGEPMSATECICKTNYAWDATLWRCVVNCADVLYSTSTGLEVDGACPCIPNFFYDMFMPQCVINCSLYNNSINSNVDNVPDQCRCRVPYTWVMEPFSCVISCAGVANVNSSRNDTPYSCECNAGYYWMEYPGVCRKKCS